LGRLEDRRALARSAGETFRVVGGRLGRHGRIVLDGSVLNRLGYGTV
jgi:hypothetical protein